jgi:transcriptional regulator with XRE-family HTH domain
MARTGRRYPAAVELCNRARAARAELGISQIALAEIIGLHFAFVSEVERGERNLSLSSLLRLADGLGVDPADLVAGLHWKESVAKPKARKAHARGGEQALSRRTVCSTINVSLFVGGWVRGRCGGRFVVAG